MVKYPRSAVTSKKGVNYVRSIVEDAGSLFHKIEQENDLGIDALIEIIVEGRPAAVQLAVQIRSGDSYYDSQVETCIIPVANHRDYWARYPLPVIGIVFAPSLQRAYWVDLKRELRADADADVIKFVASEANLLTHEAFVSVFRPTWLRDTPRLPFDRALALTRSQKRDEAWLGLRVLFHRYRNEPRTWDALIDYVFESPIDRIPRILIYYLAHIPGHPDIIYEGEKITFETHEYASARLAKCRRSDIIRLLEFIDDNGIARGVIGQSVEALVSSLPEIESHLVDIASDETLERSVNEWAAVILAMNAPQRAIPVLQQLVTKGSGLADTVISVIREAGGINPYA